VSARAPIEGYKISEDLIRRIQSGEWNPQSDAHDHDQRNALAEAGYYRAFRKVRETVAFCEASPTAASAPFSGTSSSSTSIPTRTATDALRVSS
jgi:hypothetical protein